MIILPQGESFPPPTGETIILPQGESFVPPNGETIILPQGESLPPRGRSSYSPKGSLSPQGGDLHHTPPRGVFPPTGEIIILPQGESFPQEGDRHTPSMGAVQKTRTYKAVAI
jgi:hypothetical protein